MACFAVPKIDCIQHLGKCLGAKLEEIAKSKLVACEGKSQNMGNKGRLGESSKNNLWKCLTKAIKQHARAGILSIVEQDEGAANLKQGLMASPTHS